MTSAQTLGHRICLSTLLLLLSASMGAWAQECVELPSKGQTVYVPVYSTIHHGNLDASGKTDSDLLSVLCSAQ